MPSYYRNFRCTADKCSDICCIGWEIDIDSKTYDYYKSIGGEFGNRLYENIAETSVPHFKLGKDERCPFLNDRNLCEIFINLGEDKLCEITEAKERAAKNNVSAWFEHADFCALSDTFTKQFDIVIAMDNALPHMLTSNDLASAMPAWWRYKSIFPVWLTNKR